MTVQLKAVTRENWEEALTLRVKEEQKDFVPSVAVSIAKVYIKPDGENVSYLPFAIYDDQEMVGFIMHAYVEDTTDMYWINGFIIDESHQGKAYGKAAITEMIHWIVQRSPQCEKIQLTVLKNNEIACKLYESVGFQPTGDAFGGEDVWSLSVKI
ncbi:GNAT family N-acetyltransferase [Pseudalkalibacillus decolorationis]|uniref:GNAT family N-acetyltransferase n=1 Tax=Pseudalkalibacillus decolorationis TaxID=163879 RepID=UPI00214732A7|nr:GNAT family N-acetyltransferase [Pseudalkalibacillus decolorationis]